MSLRELIILLLGLAIIGAILRGLFVALHARRGQLRVAIDKNIPSHVNLDALEMAELPGGGARVVQRDEVEGERSKLERARRRAEALDLDDQGEVVPVLMDSVAIGQPHESETHLSKGDQASNLQTLKSETAGYSNGRVAEAERVPEDMDAPQPFHDASKDAINEVEQIGCSDVAFDEFEVEKPLETGRSPIDVGQPTLVGSEVHLEGSFSSESSASGQQTGLESGNHDAIVHMGVSSSKTRSSGGLAADREHPDEVLLDYGDDDTSESVFITGEPYAPEGKDARSEQSVESDAGPVFEEETDESGPEPQTEGNDEPNQFSITPGERIGGNPVANAQAGVLDEVDTHSSQLNKRPESLASKATALFGSWRKRTNAEAEADASPEAIISASPSDRVSVHSSEIAFEPSDRRGTDEDSGFDGVDEAAAGGKAAANQRLSRAGSHSVDVQQKAPSGTPSEVQQQTSVAQPAEVIVCNVMAREGSQLHGDDLLEALITSGLTFGEMNIFHKRSRSTDDGPVIFSVANVLNPGTFDPNAMADFRTIGVSLFLALPSSINNLEAFEQMLELAINLKESLDGELKDDHRNVMTAQTIEHYRQRIRDFELRQLRAAGNSS